MANYNDVDGGKIFILLLARLVFLKYEIVTHQSNGFCYSPANGRPDLLYREKCIKDGSVIQNPAVRGT
jgi:hypothetical protein